MVYSMDKNHRSKMIFLVLEFFVLLIFTCSESEASRSRVLLRDVKTLTFHRGSYTTSAKGLSIPELQCVGGSASGNPDYHPLTAQCYNRGFDGHDVQWECKAELRKGVRFGRTVVNCEGFAYPNDEYVYAGSCGLNYELEFTKDHSNKRKLFYSLWESSSPYWSYAPLLGFFMLAFAIWFFCLRNVNEYPTPIGFERSAEPAPPSAPYPTDDPPNYEEATRGRFPPFADHSARQRSVPTTRAKYGWRAPSTGCSSDSQFCRPQYTTESSGSWLSNGLAAGAGFLGGYFFGSRDRNHSYTTTTTTRRNRLYPDIQDDTVWRSSSPSSHSQPHHHEDDDSSSYVATTFAKTTRR
ncbi:Store-operated calcium entry-associated regulatory factor [Paragonimus heterotremus]|uniref:Store-operated calcium entry-associated regulatory factor n=1 Tax=Paragonimus heterotremus TaxID=100268 RepID=A0A8J4T7I9_9TREM|nr:Store-operated calcium entry-associated regulatory factor [Paragonimus heterotremus]